MDMREKLKQLMLMHSDTANSLADKSGVPQPTISRFLSGKHGDPRSSTIRKLANAYTLTENQLRGDADIDFQAIAPAPARDPILDDLELLPEEDAAYYRALIRKEAAATKRQRQSGEIISHAIPTSFKLPLKADKTSLTHTKSIKDGGDRRGASVKKEVKK